MASSFPHHAAFDAIGDGVVVHDRDTGAILDVNERMCEMHGYTREEFLALEVEDVEAGKPPHVETSTRELIRKAATEGPQEFRQLNRRKDGTLFWVEVHFRRAELDGEECVVATVRDVTRQRRLEEELLQIQEEERRRFGRELHDGVASDLTGVALIASSLARKVRKGKQVAAEELEEVVEFINASIDEARLLSRGLSPVELEQGLASALEELATRTQRHDELSCTFETEGELPDLSEEPATHLYRIVQEAVKNAVKHAEADHVCIGLRMDDEILTLSVKDNGCGCPELSASDGGLGMRTMRYRADLTGSTLRIEEAPEGGTIVQCHFPVCQDQPEVIAE